MGNVLSQNFTSDANNDGSQGTRPTRDGSPTHQDTAVAPSVAASGSDEEMELVPELSPYKTNISGNAPEILPQESMLARGLPKVDEINNSDCIPLMCSQAPSTRSPMSSPEGHSVRMDTTINPLELPPSKFYSFPVSQSAEMNASTNEPPAVSTLLPCGAVMLKIPNVSLCGNNDLIESSNSCSQLPMMPEKAQTVLVVKEANSVCSEESVTLAGSPIAPFHDDGSDQTDIVSGAEMMHPSGPPITCQTNLITEEDGKQYPQDPIQVAAAIHCENGVLNRVPVCPQEAVDAVSAIAFSHDGVRQESMSTDKTTDHTSIQSPMMIPLTDSTYLEVTNKHPEGLTAPSCPPVIPQDGDMANSASFVIANEHPDELGVQSELPVLPNASAMANSTSFKFANEHPDVLTAPSGPPVIPLDCDMANSTSCDVTNHHPHGLTAPSSPPVMLKAQPDELIKPSSPPVIPKAGDMDDSSSGKVTNEHPDELTASSSPPVLPKARDMANSTSFEFTNEHPDVLTAPSSPPVIPKASDMANSTSCEVTNEHPDELNAPSSLLVIPKTSDVAISTSFTFANAHPDVQTAPSGPPVIPQDCDMANSTSCEVTNGHPDGLTAPSGPPVIAIAGDMANPTSCDVIDQHPGGLIGPSSPPVIPNSCDPSEIASKASPKVSKPSPTPIDTADADVDTSSADYQPQPSTSHLQTRKRNLLESYLPNAIPEETTRKKHKKKRHSRQPKTSKPKKCRPTLREVLEKFEKSSNALHHSKNLAPTNLSFSQDITPGRIWSSDDKILALSIFKQSPKYYSQLRTVIPLPHPNTLRHLPALIPLDPKESDGGSKDGGKYHRSGIGKYCYLKTDSMTVGDFLSLGPHPDEVKSVLVDKNPKMTDRLIIVAAVGRHVRWTQPVCFFLAPENAGNYDMFGILEMIKTACQSIGLEVSPLSPGTIYGSLENNL